MNAIIERAHAELVDDTPFFAPVDSDVVDGLVGQYNAMRARMERLSAMVAADTQRRIHAMGKWPANIPYPHDDKKERTHAE